MQKLRHEPGYDVAKPIELGDKMVGFLQIMIYMLAAYLVFKGFEIFQIALVSDPSRPARKGGIVIGVLAILAALLIGLGAIALSEAQAGSMQQSMPRY